MDGKVKSLNLLKLNENNQTEESILQATRNVDSFKLKTRLMNPGTSDLEYGAKHSPPASSPLWPKGLILKV